MRLSGWLRQTALGWALAYHLAAAGHAAPPVTPWTASYEEAFVSQIDRDTLEMLGEVLQLSAEQKFVLEENWKAYRQRFALFVAERKPAKDEYDQALEGLGPTSARWMQVVLKNEERLAIMADEQAALDQQFLAEARAILSDEQVALWPSFENRWMREHWVKLHGAYFEAGVDLIAITGRLETERLLPERDALLTQALSEYENRLAESLKARANFEIEMCRHAYRRDRDQWRIDLESDRAWMDTGSGDWESRYWRRRHEAGQVQRAVRDANRLSLPVVLASLPEGVRGRFEHLYYDQALLEPTRFAPRPAHGFMEVALSLDDLSEDQRTAINSVMTTHQIRFLQRAKDVIRTQEVYADTMFECKDMHFGSDDLRDRQAKQSAFNSAMSNLYEGEATAIAETWGILTEAQRHELKRPEVKPPKPLQ